MIRGLERIRKATAKRLHRLWYLDPFWRRNHGRIHMMEGGGWHGPAHPDPRGHEEELTRALDHLERSLAALEHHDETRRGFVIKLALAWVVAYILTSGEAPWIISWMWAP